MCPGGRGVRRRDVRTLRVDPARGMGVHPEKSRKDGGKNFLPPSGYVREGSGRQAFSEEEEMGKPLSSYCV